MNKGTIELSTKTIVYLLIALVVTGLAIGFVTAIFMRAGQLPDLIDVNILARQPSADEPLVLVPQEVTVESGKTTRLLAGYYNAEKDAYIRVKAGKCIDNEGHLFLPASEGLSALVEKHKKVGYRVILRATDTTTNAPLAPKHYLCELVAFETTPQGGCAQFPGGVCPQRHRVQFTLAVE